MKLLKVIKCLLSIPGLVGFVYDIIEYRKDGKIDRKEWQALTKKLIAIIGAVVKK
jgi:hypothetical protein